MAVFYGDQFDNLIDRRGTSPGPRAYGDRIYAGDGNDTVYGGSYHDAIAGEGGADYLDGGFGDDILDGGALNDVLIGGDGDDIILGGTGNDVIHGGNGNNDLRGQQGDDTYHHYVGNGMLSVINEDLSRTNSHGYGGGTDTLYLADVNGADIRIERVGNDLRVTDADDMSDGVFSDGVIIRDFYMAGNLGRIENIIGADGNGYFFF